MTLSIWERESSQFTDYDDGDKKLFDVADNIF